MDSCLISRFVALVFLLCAVGRCGCSEETVIRNFLLGLKICSSDADTRLLGGDPISSP